MFNPHFSFLINCVLEICLVCSVSMNVIVSVIDVGYLWFVLNLLYDFCLSAFRALLQIRAMRKKLSPLSPTSFNPVITSQTSDSEEHSVRHKKTHQKI